jgi:hypothetical protein
MIVFSPSLYFTVRIGPSTPLTVWPTALDVGDCRLHHADNKRIVGERQGERAVGRFDVQRIALDFVDGAVDALGLLP